MTKEELELGNAIWGARQKFIADGESQSFPDYMVADDGVDKYCFKVMRVYALHSDGTGLMRDSFIEFGPGKPFKQTPHFNTAKKAIEWLEKSPVPGVIQRYVAKNGFPTWMTAGIAHEKFAGERDYEKGKELIREYYEKGL